MNYRLLQASNARSFIAQWKHFPSPEKRKSPPTQHPFDVQSETRRKNLSAWFANGIPKRAPPASGARRGWNIKIIREDFSCLTYFRSFFQQTESFTIFFQVIHPSRLLSSSRWRRKAWKQMFTLSNMYVYYPKVISISQLLFLFFEKILNHFVDLSAWR